MWSGDRSSRRVMHRGGEVMTDLTPETRASDAQTSVIEPRHGWRDLGIVELSGHREFLYFFVRHNLPWTPRG
jgi:hypothetical protein